MINNYGFAKFVCGHCGREVVSDKSIGTKQRNHCPFCLWSKHVDDQVSGDRKSDCYGDMEPIALTFREEGVDKYGKKRQGEIMLVHRCIKCQKISLNRIAGDDDEDEIINIYNKSLGLPIIDLRYPILKENDATELYRQLGKS
ncbi:MAG: RNHCP domain-containing protein [bacterium]